jgi:hypothetical protein
VEGEWCGFGEVVVVGPAEGLSLFLSEPGAGDDAVPLVEALA